ncbi:14337_t:CDS:2 [Funneliformis caledonium]|uniref:14337_t:CDS:1 n=1 Tax=Funneliformis caledonium TaxID=1117310 RepID=A0A9N9FX76_9GLOM|nr:14337_t:CDS:2 [Funneliformis caledonium]
MQSQANTESILKSILVVGKIRDYINCEYCRKRHCVYNDRSLTYEEEEDYQQALESYSYSCESEGLVTPSQSLKERFKQIYPLCEECQNNQKEFHTRTEIKTNGCSFKRHKK